jgi:hypothetical protein
MNLSFVIPVAPHHKQLLPRAIESVKGQTAKCQALYMIDEEERGAGWVRNQILAKVTTPYVAFLDADDWLEPTFAEDCLNAMQLGRYVYTNWYEGDTKVVNAPSKPWCNGTWHVITCMFNTADIQRLGGFDESLPALEDTDLFLKLTTNQICGIHVDKPLMHYSKDGLRSSRVHATGESENLRQHILKRYANQMGCCGDNDGYDNATPVGERQAGDVLAMAMWAGNKRTTGKATGRRYPRLSYPKKTWVHPGDIAREPHMWQRVSEPVAVIPQPTITDEVRYQNFDGVIAGMKDVGAINAPPPPSPPVVAASFDDFNPDIVKVIDLAKKGMEG